LWNESVDASLTGAAWEQPHLNSNADATDVEVYLDFIQVHAQIRRDPKEKELKKLGFDQKRELIVSIPLSLLDQAEITAQPGDYFIHDNIPWMVKQLELTGYWHNTAIKMYAVLGCDQKRGGS
jgi:hypothetical protein